MTAAIREFSIPPIVKTVIVECSAETAFEIFTAQIGLWYPLEKFSIRPALDCRIEPFVGGRIYEIGIDDEESLWGYVLEWDAPHRLSISWQARVSADEAQRVDISFRALPQGTEVTLIHSGWEHLKIDARAWRDKYDGGWIEIFQHRYKSFADTAA